MISSFDKEALFSLIKDLYTVIGIRISIFDDEFNVVTEYPTTAPEICSLIRTTDEGQAACRECDRAACERAKKKRAPHVYLCHAGISEAISPIQLNDGILGYAIFAHMLPDDNYEKAEEIIIQRCLKYGFDEAELKAAVKNLKTYSTDKIMASIRLLDAISAYLQMKNLASWKNEELAGQIQTYIDKNLDSPLSSDMLCKRFYISRTKMYQLSMKAFGMGITQYITKKRIDKVKELLKSGNYSVAQAARTVGFEDYNYFCKLFKKQTGRSPSQYKNQDRIKPTTAQS